jgi:ATP-dependent RNA helicase DDX56/DBP9
MGDTSTSQFHNFDIDERILKGIAKLGWKKPTLVQDKAIPFIMDGKDVLIRARTGSGKTGAYSIPVIQNLLKLKEDPNYKSAVHCLILAPSKELCHQIKGVIDDLTIKCRTVIQTVDLSLDTEQTTLQNSMLSDNPDIVVATPSKILSYVKRKCIKLKKSVKTVIVDEADLMFSFGFKDDLKLVLDSLPSIYQAVLAAATLSSDMMELKQIMLHKPVIIKFEESDIPAETQLKQYKIMAEEEDKAAIIYVLLKLHLIRGKTIIFVNSVDKCYK